MLRNKVRGKLVPTDVTYNEFLKIYRTLPFLSVRKNFSSEAHELNSTEKKGFFPQLRKNQYKICACQYNRYQKNRH
jgi:hypothetical protein